MSQLEGAVGEMQFTVCVTRKETGETEEYQMTGFVNENQLVQLQAAGIFPTTQEQ